MIVDWQYEPIKGALLHIDLKRIAMDQDADRQRARSC
jgi:large subunit ribosomal protein L25